MANIILPPGWRIPECDATPESVYWNRKAFIRTLGWGAAALATGACSSSSFTPTEFPDEVTGTCFDIPPRHPLQTICERPTASFYPAARNETYKLDRPITDRLRAATHNNFYEFIGRPSLPNVLWDLTGPFQVSPWTVQVSGEVEKPGTFDVDDLVREFALEERVYRLRCVEAWAIAVPWTGFPLSKLIDKVRPLSSAQYVRFVSFKRPDEAVGQRDQTWYPWPYYEALRMDEARNELAIVATGIYGQALPKQHGAPLRLVVPWKYGFKNIKSFVRMEFLRELPFPATFWTEVEPNEYGFYSNVNPNVPHPRWSQAMEVVLGEQYARATMIFNGYGEWVADLYDPQLLTYRS